MTKGKYGISLVAVAIVAFFLAFFGLLEALVLILAFALILEKDQWLSRQVFQAFYLRLAYVAAVTVIGWVFTAINALFGLFNAYRVISFFSGFHNVVNFLLQVGLFVLALIAVLRLAKGKDAGLPLISGLVDATFGLIKPKEKPVQTPPPAAPAGNAPYQAPYQQQSYTPAPAPQQAPASADSAQPAYREPAVSAAPPPKNEEKPAAPVAPPPAAAPVSDSWVCSCGKENKGNFCAGCGQRKPS